MSGLVLMIAGRPVSDIHVLRYDMDKCLTWIYMNCSYLNGLMAILWYVILVTIW